MVQWPAILVVHVPKRATYHAVLVEKYVPYPINIQLDAEDINI